MNCKNKSFMTKKKAFTLIELLIVIAIIGILFIVLVSKVDFATDKAKATGVQTDFRSFQMAFDTVAKENAGFNTFGWDTGDANQDGIRNSYDEGDTNKDGIQNGTEVFTGHKVYAETFTKVYSLKKNGTGDYDREALNRLETAINANLDPKLHITIKDDGEIVMANGAQDPWNKEYHGWYITNAETDKKDRGAIIMYSDGANNEFGSEHTIANGVVKVIVPGSNKDGKDDYSIVSLYTYVNGYGEVKNTTTGFSNNQTMLGGNNIEGPSVEPDSPVIPDDQNLPVNGIYEMLEGENQIFDLSTPNDLTFRSKADFDKFSGVKVDGVAVESTNYTVREGSTIVTLKADYLKTLDMGEHYVEVVSNDGVATISFNCIDTALDVAGLFDSNDQLICTYDYLIENEYLINNNGVIYTYDSLYGGTKAYDFIQGKLVLPSNKGIVGIGTRAFYNFFELKEVVLPHGIEIIGSGAFQECGVESLNLPSTLKTIESHALWDNCVTSVTVPANVTYIGTNALFHMEAINVDPNNQYYASVDGVLFNKDMTTLIKYPYCKSEDSFVIHDSVTTISDLAFSCNQGPKSITLSDTIIVDGVVFDECYGLENIYVSNSNTNYKSIDGVLYSYDMKTLIKYPYSKEYQDFVIPSTVTTIGKYAFFQGCVPFNLTIPESVTLIEANALGESAVVVLTIMNPYDADYFYAINGSFYLTTIIFNGTKNDFYNLNLNETWYNMLEYMPIQTIECIDGVINLRE